MTTKPHILFCCHKHPHLGFDGKPRGAEISMQIIMKYLRRQGHKVTAWARGAETETIGGITYFGGKLERRVEKADVVFTWGRPALRTTLACMDAKKPLILLVRWWRNIHYVPPGDLMNRPIDPAFNDAHRIIFEYASDILTNSHYAKDVIKRYYGVSAQVSYVPIPGQPKKLGNPDGALTLITPNKELGEFELLAALSGHVPRQTWVVNCPENEIGRYSSLGNTRVDGYIRDMDEVWRNTSVLLCPIYYNDICGTLRVSIEAMKNGVPVLANMRSGIDEKVPNLVSRSAARREWVDKIDHILCNYEQHQNQAIEIFKQYDTPGQLKLFKDAVEKALCTV